MRVFLIVAAILLSACASSAAPSADNCSVRVTVSPAGADALAAHYQLCAPATTFALEEYNSPQRSADWTPAEAGFTFDGVNVARSDGAAFSDFTLRIRADSNFYDRRYVATDRVGSGWSLFLPTLAPSESSATLQLRGFAPDDIVFTDGHIRRAASVRLALDPGGLAIIYVGPRANIRTGAITFIAGDDIPDWLRERLVSETTVAVERMTARFGRRPAQPTLIVTQALEGRGHGTKGGVVSDDVVEIRLRGAELREDDVALTESLTNTATHEAVHLWIGHIWNAARNNEEPWLHEGAAEYLASRIWQTPDSLRAESTQRLNGCLLRTNGRPMDGSEGPVHGPPPYDCGFAIMLAAETASLRAGRGDIFDLWRAVVDRAGPDGFTPSAFLAEARARGGEDFARVATLLMSTVSNPEIATIAEPLAAIGIFTEAREAAAAEGYILLGRSLMPVMTQLCAAGGRSYGYSTAPDRIILDSEQTCGATVAGNPEVVSVNGASLIAAPAAAYEAIRAACNARSALRFTTLSGRVLAPVTCTTQIAPLPRVYDITSLPALPQP